MKKFNIPLNLSEEYVISETPTGSEPLHVERIINQFKRPIIYVTANREKQERFIEGCNFLCPNIDVETLPAWLQIVAWCTPSAYVFEGMRSVLIDNIFQYDLLLGAILVNIVYLFAGIFVFAFSFKGARKQGKLLQTGE